MLDLAGLPIPAGTQGRTLLPASPGRSGVRREGFIYEGVVGYGGTPPFLAAITTRWKLIFTWEQGAPIKASSPSFVELYDRESDPDEARNMVHVARQKGVRQSLARMIERHLDQIR